MRRAPGRPRANGGGRFLSWTAHASARARRARGLRQRRHLRRPPRPPGTRGAPHHAWSWVIPPVVFFKTGGAAEDRICRTIVVWATSAARFACDPGSRPRATALPPDE